LAQPEALLALDALEHTNDAPTDMVVNGCRLARQPDHRYDRKRPAWRHCNEVRAIPIQPGFTELWRKKRAVFEQQSETRLHTFSDAMRIALCCDHPLDSSHEGFETHRSLLVRVGRDMSTHGQTSTSALTN